MILSSSIVASIRIELQDGVLLPEPMVSAVMPIFTKIVWVTVAPLLWDERLYSMDADHVESCSRFLQQVANSLRQEP